MSYLGMTTSFLFSSMPTEWRVSKGVWRKCDHESCLDIPFPSDYPFSDSRSAHGLRADTGIAEVAPLEGPAGFDPSLWLPWGISFPNLPNASRKNGFA